MACFVLHHRLELPSPVTGSLPLPRFLYSQNANGNKTLLQAVRSRKQVVRGLPPPSHSSYLDSRGKMRKKILEGYSDSEILCSSSANSISNSFSRQILRLAPTTTKSETLSLKESDPCFNKLSS